MSWDQILRRHVAEGRSESDACTRLTIGCCIDHEAEEDRNGSCEPW